MPLGAPPPLAFALSLPGAAPGAAGCWACVRRVMSAAKAATNRGPVRSFMTDDCTRNGGRLAAWTGSAVECGFPSLHDGGDVYPEVAWNQADPGGACTI